jgi:hypothetical protein
LNGSAALYEAMNKAGLMHEVYVFSLKPGARGGCWRRFESRSKP